MAKNQKYTDQQDKQYKQNNKSNKQNDKQGMQDCEGKDISDQKMKNKSMY